MPKAQTKAKREAERDPPSEKLTRKAYERELARLHAELVKLQLWIVATGLKVCVVFEGRDGGPARACSGRQCPPPVRGGECPMKGYRPTERGMRVAVSPRPRR